MDDNRFDTLARVAANLPSRRKLIRTLLGGVGSGLLLSFGVAEESAARKCKKDGDCKGCQTCNRKKKKCAKGCPKGKQCCGGECVKKDLCCDSSADCNACSQCVEGRCQADTSKNGQKCSGCLTCANGACGIADDQLCEDQERCRQSTGLCCPKCVNDRCCSTSQACIDPGALSANFCCDRSNNTPCGDNGDGTFSECCSNFNERCVNGECVPKDECPTRGRAGKAGLCCAEGTKVCPGLNDPYCAPENQACCGEYTCDVGEDCCDPQNNICCEQGRCLGKLCCPSDQIICGSECCDYGDVCCGGVCCSNFDCIDEACCETGACGDIGADTRVCPTENETCCLTDDSDPAIGNRGYACPPSTPVCSNIGQCCPNNYLYSQSCAGCCPSILSCENCVSPISGRT
jgi:hypothetical protein